VIDELIRTRVDDRLRELGIDRADSRARDPTPSPDPQDVNVSISLEGRRSRRANGTRSRADSARLVRAIRLRTTERQRGSRTRGDAVPDGRDSGRQCNQCGDRLDGDHMYCPNCGEKASRRLFCECGDEVRSDWSFCPPCGRRTPAADVLESDSTQF